MNWTHIPSSETCFNITVSDKMKVYQFAISANSQSTLKADVTSPYQPISSSSGMVWVSCTVLQNKIIGKIKNVRMNMIGSTSMELSWNLDCSDRIGAVLGFRIFYCPVVSIHNSTCREPMLNKTVSGKMAHDDSRGIASITDLKSHTTYVVTIALVTKHGEGLYSDPLLYTTLEGAPDIQNLIINVTRLTNTTVSLQWSNAKFKNGVVRYYHIDYYSDDIFQQQDLIDSFDEQQVVNEQRRITVHDTKCRLDHLESYRSYTITVTACTTVCSERSLPIKVRTAVGMPGRVSQPNLFYENSTRIAVSWPKLMKPAGPIDYYELIVMPYSRPKNARITYCGFSSSTDLSDTQIQENPNNSMYQSVSNVFHMPVPDCNNERYSDRKTLSLIVVRAVNNNPLNPHRPYYGQWSVPGSVSCVLPAPIQNIMINVTRLTNTTISQQWSPPEFTNGVVRYYHIDYYLDDTILQQHDFNGSYFDEQQVIDEQRRLTVHDTKCRLDHLEGYRRYAITITECTTVCTERSLPIKVRTAIGRRVHQLNVLKTRNGIEISWARPVKPAGPVDLYDLIIVPDSGRANSQSTNDSSSSSTALDSVQIRENPDSKIYQFMPNSKDKFHPHDHLPSPNCFHKFWSQQKFLFAVRAVNRNLLDPQSPYYGKWSVPKPVTVCSLKWVQL